MKIPDAYFSGGLGQRVPQLSAGPQPDASGGIAIGAAARRLGDTITGIANDQLTEEKKLQKARDDAAAQAQMYAHKNDLSLLVDEVTSNPEIAPEKYLEAFQGRAGEVRAKRVEGMDEIRLAGVSPALDQQRYEFEQVVRRATEKKLQEQTLGSVIKAKEELFNSPSYSFKDKIAIMSDPLFWEGTGLSEPTIQKEVLDVSQKLYEGEVLGWFNNLPAKEVKALLSARSGPGGDKPVYLAGAKPTGLVEAGNIDLARRPVHENTDGTISTVRSISVTFDDGKSVLLPTISPEGKPLSEEQAVSLYRETGKHLGVFRDESAATAYAESLHQQQSAMYSSGAGQYVNLPQLNPLKRESYIAHADDEIARAEAEAERAARERRALVERQTRDFFEAMKTHVSEGFPLTAELDVNARMRLKGTEYEPLYAEVKRQANSLSFQQGLVNKDPLLFYARRNGFEIPPLDLSNVATLPQQVSARRAFSAAAQEALNLPYRPDLLADESKVLGVALEKADGPGRVQIVKTWSGLLGKESMTQFAKQVSGSGSGSAADNSALALEIVLAANGKDQAAAWVAGGRDYLQAIKVPEKIREKQDNAFNALAGDALKLLGRTREDYRNAVNAAYVHLAKAQGLDVERERDLAQPGFFSGGSEAGRLYLKAFRAVVGETVDINGKVTVLPLGMTQDGFRNAVKGVSPETIAAAGGVRGLPSAAAAERLIEDATLLEMGNGVYAFELDGEAVRREDGELFRLRFGQ